MPVYAATNPTATGEAGTKGSGGGGGVVGGVAGEAVLHYHDENCYKNISVPLKYKSNHYEDNDENNIHHKEYYTDYIDLQGATSIIINVTMDRRIGDNTHNDGEGVTLYNQNGGVIWSANQSTIDNYVRQQWNSAGYGNDWRTSEYSYIARDNYSIDTSDWSKDYDDTSYAYLHYDTNGNAKRYYYCTDKGWGSSWPSPNASSFFIPSSECHTSNWWGSTTYRYRYTINIPNNTTKIKFQTYINAGDNFDLPQISASVTLNHVKSCAYYDGEVVRSKASFGGTSNASTTDTINNTALNVAQSEQIGNGTFKMRVINGNILNGVDNISHLNNVSIRDLAYPDMIKKIEMKESSNQRIITWEAPQSNGTEYELKAQTYKIDFTSNDGVELLMDTEFN